MVWDIKKTIIEEVKDPIKKTHRRKTECIELSTKYIYRRAFSELNLINCCPELKQNHSYNFITGGDVDALSFFKLCLREQNIEHVLFSTWCMNAEDILQFDEWLTAGKIKRLDAYLGEIFPNSYKVEYKLIKEVFEKHNCGRIAIFKNHSKIFAGYGDKFHFGIQTSSNINTNPRTENACITINKDIYEFYKQYFDGIKSFEK